MTTTAGTITDHGDRSTIRFERRLPFPIDVVWAALTEQEVLVWDPPRVLELDWRQRNVGPTIVRYELTAEGEGTVLVLTHRGLRPTDARGYIPGQHDYLDRLRAYLDGTAIPDWETRYGDVASVYA